MGKRYSNNKINWLMSGVLSYALLVNVSYAQEAPLIQGYVDSSYNYLSQSNQFTSGTYDRLYDLEENGFTLQQITLMFQKLPSEGWGGYAAVIGGSDANEVSLKGWNPYFGSQTLAFIVPEAYLRFSKGPVTLSAGLQSSLVGEESYLYTNNVNFSHSILDDVVEPGRHIGFRLTVKPDDRLTLMIGANNGWSTLEHPAHLTSMELGAGYTFNSSFSTALQFYNGPQGIQDDDNSGPEGNRQLVNIIATYHATPALDLIVSGDYATQMKAGLPHNRIGSALWKGVAGYVNYKFNDAWMMSVRGETFDDKNGYRTGVVQDWHEVTLTVGWQVFNPLLIRAETRHDFSSVNAFLTKNHLGSRQQQQSYALEGLYTF